MGASLINGRRVRERVARHGSVRRGGFGRPVHRYPPALRRSPRPAAQKAVAARHSAVTDTANAGR